MVWWNQFLLLSQSGLNGNTNRLHVFDPGFAVKAMSVKLKIPFTACTNVFPIKFAGNSSDVFDERMDRVADDSLSDFTMFPN